MNIAGIPTRLRYHWPVVCLVGIISLLHSSGWQADARDLVAPKEQSTTEIDPTQSPSFDEQKKGIPQSLFTWIKMAKGYDVEWDSFGRKGWYTQDPRLKPIEPTSVFTPDTPAIYIVFEVAPLEDPAQFGAQWFQEAIEGKLPDTPMGKDSLEVPGHERYGFLELKRKEEKWPVGKVPSQNLHHTAGTTTLPCGESSGDHAVFHRRLGLACSLFRAKVVVTPQKDNHGRTNPSDGTGQAHIAL